MASKRQWIMSATEIATNVARFTPRVAQRAYLVADGGMLESVIVVTSVRTQTVNGFTTDDKDVTRVDKAAILAYLASKGEILPAITEMFVRPDPALSSTSITALEVVITDDTSLGGV